ncbi:1-acyl-sn-glycerol-3-phosphate acyltransferase PLS1-like [Diospyros lotus]|uniref:1-acyl-sn-glycerol-3-phosphate acyltransferase PLS1-like n=1 Tax=Diospyros lotus TaxID=55363 RepID=UPI0022563B8B|nr:1-acyl-sn-glycerol-3-phosphate acyltransferase PLS1-like [Diospyros lotus]
MAIAAVVVLPLGLLFLLSGLVVNFIQAVCFVLFRPFSQSLYRRINRVVIELLWLQIVWLFDWWANMKVELYTDSETFQFVGKEHALLIPNHRSDIDWLVGWVLAERAGCLGSTVAIMKKSSKYLPVLGWSMWFSDYVFLERNWAKDEETLKSGFQHLKNFPQPLWLALFVEGTRFTQEKLLAAQEYAVSAGLPVPRHVLVPHTKGFVSAVNHLRSFVPAIYDITVAIPKNEPQPTMLRIFRGRSSVIQVHVKRHLMEELPETSSDIADWCRNMFVAKDALLEQHLIKGTFADKECQEIGRPKKSLFVVISWLCLLLYGSYNFFEWLSVLPSWEVLTLCITFLTIAMIIMHILIVFSQSEHSTPPKVPSRDPLKENLLQN